jgi:hypothetical protein
MRARAAVILKDELVRSHGVPVNVYERPLGKLPKQ